MNRARVFPFVLVAVIVVRAGADEPNAIPPASAQRYEQREEHDPNGIGKFYMGREIARVMGHTGASWLDRPEREREEQPQRLLDALALKPGDTVADIGAGSGFHSFRMAERVGRDGRIFAVDIQPEMLAIIRRRAEQRGVSNIELIAGTETDPRLPPGSCDLVLMVDVYHEFSHPWEMSVALVRALKPGGRLVFVEFRLEDPDVPIKRVHKMSEQQVRKEMQPHAVRWATTIDVLPWQHIIVFEKTSPGQDDETRENHAESP